MQNPFVRVEKIEPEFGIAVRDARLEIGWSQARLATVLTERGMKLDATAITRIEKGQRNVRLSEAIVIASVLGIDLEPLVARAELPEDSFRLAREEVNRAIAEARGALQALAFNLNDITLTLEEGDTFLDLMRTDSEGAVTQASDYVPWVAGRLRAQRGTIRAVLPVEDEKDRSALLEVLQILAEQSLVTFAEYDQLKGRSVAPAPEPEPDSNVISLPIAAADPGREEGPSGEDRETEESD